MTDFAGVHGFEEIWRPVARSRSVGDRGVLPRTGGDSQARLIRIVRRAPEVMVKITGKTGDADHLQAHLRYVSRDGSLSLEGRDGLLFIGAIEVAELGHDWASDDLRRRRDASITTSLVLSMPPGTPPVAVKDAARAFAAELFGERFDYVFALHTDADHPHVHLTVRSLGADGERLNPRKADLDHWRQTFARLLRDREVEAEATPRRARGIVRKPEVIALRKLRDRHEAGRGDAPRVMAAARLEAERIARRELTLDRPWERAILRRTATTRDAYLVAAAEAERAGDADLGAALRSFVRSMPSPVTKRNISVRAIRMAESRERRPDDIRSRERPDASPERTR